MEHITSFNTSVDKIQEYLAACTQAFETSQLYSAARNEKFTDEDLRKSKFRPIVDPKLFDLVENVISNLNDNDDSYTYSLRRNDVTHIVYEKGGFFKRHRDYLSTTSNLIEEFTLLLCVTPAELSKKVDGGDDMLGSGAETVFLPGNTIGRKDDGASLFHRDGDGLVAFSSTEVDRASDYIANLGLEERVKACLQKKRFVLPQEMDEVGASFCNESVYGKLNVLWVSGVIRMDPTKDNGKEGATTTKVDLSSSAAKAFDAWPSKEAKDRNRQARDQIWLKAENDW